MNIRGVLAIAAFMGLMIVFFTNCSNQSSKVDDSPNLSNEVTSVDTKANQKITGFDHFIDFYVPSNATRAIIFLHGGGGHKEPFENDLGLKANSGTSDYELTSAAIEWLKNEKVMAIFPQGQTLTGYNAWTWNNYVMDSGVDDVTFLQNLVAWVKSNPLYANITKFYLVGHSNGGMMANRMWCESPNTFDGFGSLAGPASPRLDPSLPASSTHHPCQPATVKPFISIVGNSDRVLQTTGNMSAASWTLSPLVHIGNPPTWIDNPPTVLNDTLFYVKKVQLKCGTGVSSPISSGSMTVYSDCGSSLQHIIVAQAGGVGGDHCLGDPTGPCVSNLRGNSGLDYKQTLIDFFKNH